VVLFNFFFMWLFDELIKKPSQTPIEQGWEIWGTQAPLTVSPPSETIVIKEESSIMTEPPIREQKNLWDTPAPIKNSANDGEWILIVWWESSPISESLESSSEGVVSVSEDENLTTPTENIEKPIEVLGYGSKESLLEKQHARMHQTEKEGITAEQEWLLDSLLGWENTETILATETVATQTENIDTTSALYFIKKSLSEIEVLIAGLNLRHDKELTEAYTYKAEKERNALLEESCYQRAVWIEGEKTHAEKMRKYLIWQQDIALWTTEPSSSVETTLTTLAVKKTVGDTTTKAKKQKTEVVSLV
jgi:hypothetical protein